MPEVKNRPKLPWPDACIDLDDFAHIAGQFGDLVTDALAAKDAEIQRLQDRVAELEAEPDAEVERG